MLEYQTVKKELENLRPHKPYFNCQDRGIPYTIAPGKGSYGPEFAAVCGGRTFRNRNLGEVVQWVDDMITALIAEG